MQEKELIKAIIKEILCDVLNELKTQDKTTVDKSKKQEKPRKAALKTSQRITAPFRQEVFEKMNLPEDWHEKAFIAFQTDQKMFFHINNVKHGVITPCRELRSIIQSIIIGQVTIDLIEFIVTQEKWRVA